MVLTGEEAFWKDSAIIVKESQFVSFDETGKKNLIGTFDENRIVLKPNFQELSIKIKDVEALSITELIRGLKKIEATEVIKYKIEIFRKLALVFSTVPLAVIGFCLSLGHHRISKIFIYLSNDYSICLYYIFKCWNRYGNSWKIESIYCNLDTKCTFIFIRI